MKKKLIVVGAAALTVAAAGTAMAFENQFNGMLKIKGDFSNFDLSGNGSNTLLKTNGKDNRVFPPKKDGLTHAYVEQRARLFYTAKASDDLKLVTGFEIDSRWGDTSQNPGNATDGPVSRNTGGAIETDQVNLETKHVYLDFKIPSTPVKATVGLLPFNDAYKGVFLNADVAAAILSAKTGDATTTVGWARGYDNITPLGAPTGGLTAGRYSLDLTVLDFKYAVSKDLSVGASDYLVYENVGKGAGLGTGYNLLNTVGVNASANVGPATIDGFFLAQFGDMPYNGNAISNSNKVGKKTTAFAANVGAKVKAGPGTVRGNILWASGDNGDSGNNSAFQGLNQIGGSTGNFSAAQMTMLISTTKHAMNTDSSLIGTTTNYNQGMLGAFFGYDLAINKMFASANLGMAMTDKNNNNAPANKTTLKRNGSQYIGTEINAEVGYKLYDNLSASFVAGYVILGDYYKNTSTNQNGGANADPDNPWKTQLVLAYAF